MIWFAICMAVAAILAALAAFYRPALAWLLQTLVPG